MSHLRNTAIVITDDGDFRFAEIENVIFWGMQRKVRQTVVESVLGREARLATAVVD
jgi:hypothetical protein